MIQNQIKEQSLKVKMCGMRRKEDIAYANEVKPDAIGYIFFSKSKRYVTGQQARELDQNLDQKILSVGVFVNETIEKVTEIADEVPLDVIQLHGDEDIIYIKTIIAELILVLQRDLLSHEKEEARLQVEREKLKSTLLRSISHDLRTPLTSIAGGANFLVNNLDTVESDISLNIIQDISKEAMRLNGMVENLLNMTRIQEGNFKINKKLEVVDDIISTAVSAITNRKENHELVVKETKDIILFPCDAQLIVQVLVNLLDNAFKHTPDASKVMLKAFVRNNNIIFQVIDNGKGIEIKQLNHIFDDFFTTSLDNGDHKRGIGLGLAICKAIVEAHKGEIKAFNNDLGGATFELSLPLEEENNE